MKIDRLVSFSHMDACIIQSCRLPFTPIKELVNVNLTNNIFEEINQSAANL